MDPEDILQACLKQQKFFDLVFTIIPEAIKIELQPFYFAAHDAVANADYETALENYKTAEEIARGFFHKTDQKFQKCGESDEETYDFNPFETDHPITFNDIVGLDECKELIKQVLVYPCMYPHLAPTRPKGVMGIMMFGFSGCGKSLLAQATATEIKAPFYNIQVSQLQSKYRGESENRVRKLFAALRQHEVSVLFLDEFDSITGCRDGKEQMAAFKNELLVEMSGVSSNSHRNFVVVLAATNLPETIDPAFLSRFRHKIFVPLPDGNQRQCLIQNACEKLKVQLSVSSLEYLRERTKGYSCRDIAGILQCLNYVPMKKVLAAKHFVQVQPVEDVPRFAPTNGLDPVGFEGKAENVGLQFIVQPQITEHDVLESFESSGRSPNVTSAGMMQFARRYCINKPVQDDGFRTDENEMNLRSCITSFVLCCMWGK